MLIKPSRIETTPAQKELLREFARDLSVCTQDEILARWSQRERDALEEAAPGQFKRRLKNHNPIYYLAEQVFFDNTTKMEVERRKKFLYAPLHRDKLSAEDVRYYFAEPEETAGHLLLMMRGSYKSTFRHGVVPLWITLREFYLNNYHAKIGLIHQLEDKAISNLIRLKSKALAHPWFKSTWPEFSSDKDFGTKKELTWPCVPDVKYAAEPSIIARGIGADLTGYHFDHIFFSDLVVAKHITSQQERTMTKKRHDATMYTILSGKPWYDGTRYHPRDLYADMIDAKDDETGESMYRVFQLKAEEEDGTLNLPHKYPKKTLDNMQRKEISRSGNDLLFHLQMNCNVYSTHAVASDIRWLRDTELLKVKRGGFRVITVEPAWKGTDTFGKGDFASIQVWNLIRKGSVIEYTLIDGVHSNSLTDDEGITNILKLARRYNVKHAAPEERGGKSFRQRLKNESLSNGWPLVVIDLQSMQTGKDQRMAAFVGQAQAGRVYVCKDCNPALRAAFIDQFGDFGQLEHDDALDGAAYVCDPVMSEYYSPHFGGYAEDEDSFFAEDDYGMLTYDPYTRHCMN